MKYSAEYRYSLILEECGDAELRGFFTYGLLAEKVTAGKWERVQVLHDVSPDLELASHMAELFNIHQLHPIHLKDAAEDMLP